MTRIVRTAMVSELDKDYVRNAIIPEENRHRKNVLHLTLVPLSSAKIGLHGYAVIVRLF